MTSDVPSFSSEKFIAKHAANLTSHRLKIVKNLVKKTWFIATDPKLQDTLVTLIQTGEKNYDGFLESLARRKEEIGGIRTLRLLSLPMADYTLCPLFEVQNIQTGAIYTYDYAAYRHGVPAGAKGLLFIRQKKGSEPTHVILLSGEKFSTGEGGYEMLGGLPEVTQNERQEVIKGIAREIREETGVKNLEIEEIKLLGTLKADPGHTSHETHFFVAYVSEQEAEKISTHAKNLDDYELNTFVHILPLSAITNIANNTTNALLLAAFTKVLTAGIVPLKYYQVQKQS